MFKKILLIFTLLLPFYAFSGTQTGKVAWLIVRASDGLIYFGIEGSPASGKPQCATLSYWMIRDENSNVGKQQYSLLLTAYASGKPVEIVGMNSCKRWGDGEDVDYIKIK
ncbi:hypothetical protein FLL98_00860 [Vibrio cholerae]|uniref:hypothetical protein n=1 Tax=Vibrio cholerae TaxID=666 RepID=UPI000E09EFA3|nr:hypothetical protein [Vibrio cholerae]TQP57169.1 hypothetical protein FLL98_00860 [Vibrio cholerae]